MSNTRIKKPIVPTAPVMQPAPNKPAQTNAKVADIEKLWKSLNSQQIATWQRRNEKIESFIALVNDLAGDDDEKAEKIQRVLAEFEPFKNSSTAVKTLINMVCNYIDLPEKVQDLAHPTLSSDTYRAAQ